MTQIYNLPECDAILVVDATNAFDSLNHQVALQDINSLCPILAMIIINAYRANIDLYIDGEIMLSQEYVTQGDPLLMARCAISTIPRIAKLSYDNIKKIRNADDASARGYLKSVLTWWNNLIQHMVLDMDTIAMLLNHDLCQKHL